MNNVAVQCVCLALQRKKDPRSGYGIEVPKA